MPKRFVFYFPIIVVQIIELLIVVDAVVLVIIIKEKNCKITASNVTEDMLPRRNIYCIHVFCFWPDTALSIVHHCMTFILLLLHLLVCDQNFTG